MGNPFVKHYNQSLASKPRISPPSRPNSNLLQIVLMAPGRRTTLQTSAWMTICSTGLYAPCTNHSGSTYQRAVLNSFPKQLEGILSHPGLLIYFPPPIPQHTPNTCRRQPQHRNRQTRRPPKTRPEHPPLQQPHISRIPHTPINHTPRPRSHQPHHQDLGFIILLFALLDLLLCTRGILNSGRLGLYLGEIELGESVDGNAKCYETETGA